MEEERQTVEQMGGRIRERRESLGLSLSQLSSQSDVSKAFLWEIERGNAKRPGAQVLMKVAAALKWTIAELMGESVASKGVVEPVVNQALKDFIAERKKNGRPLEKDEVDSLAYVQFRGQRPQSIKDWEAVYFLLEQRTGDEDEKRDS